MMMRRSGRGLLFTIGAMVSVSPAAGQFLDSFLHTQRDNNVRQRQPAPKPSTQKQPSRPAAKNATACSPNALPAADRRRMEAEYARRTMRDGRQSADAWSAEQGRAFRAKLVAEGVCKPLPSSATTATRPAERPR